MSATTGVPALREIRGPSAFGGGAKRFFDLTWLMSVTEFKLSYFGTVFGYLWSLIRPLILFAVLYTVFTRILRFDAPNYAQLLLLNLTLYGLFSEATTRAVRSVVTSERIVRKMQFPRLVIPLSVVLTSLFNLCLSLIAVLVFIAASGVAPRITWLALPLIVVVLAVLTTGVSLLLSAVLRPLSGRGTDVGRSWCWSSSTARPSCIPWSSSLRDLKFLLFLNPLAPIMVEARRLVVDPTAPSAVDADAAGSVFGIIGPAMVMLAVCAIGLWTFMRAAPRVAEEL